MDIEFFIFLNKHSSCNIKKLFAFLFWLIYYFYVLIHSASKKKEILPKKQVSKQETSPKQSTASTSQPHDNSMVSENRSFVPKTKSGITQQESESEEPTKTFNESHKDATVIPKSSPSKTEQSSTLVNEDISLNNKHSSLGAQVPVNNTSYDILDDLMGLTPKHKTAKTVRKPSSPEKESPNYSVSSLKPSTLEKISPNSSVLSQLMGPTTSTQSTNKKRKLEEECDKEVSLPSKKTVVPESSKIQFAKKVCAFKLILKQNQNKKFISAKLFEILCIVCA